MTRWFRRTNARRTNGFLLEHEFESTLTTVHGWSFIRRRAHMTTRSPLLHARVLRTPLLATLSRTDAINAAGLQQNAAVTPATIAN